MPAYEIQFLEALGLTILFELIIGITLIKVVPTWFGFSKDNKSHKSNWVKIILGIFLASTLTLPYIWFIWPLFLKERSAYIIVSELWAWLMEAVFYRYYFPEDTAKGSWKKALIYSFALNACSFLVGLLIN